MGGQPGLLAVGQHDADFRPAMHRRDQGGLVQQARGAHGRQRIAGVGAGQALQLPGVAGHHVGAGDQLVGDGLGHLGRDIEALAGISHGGIDDHRRPAGAGPLARCLANGVDGPGGGSHLGAGREIAGDHQVGHAKQAIGLDAVQHPLNHLDGRRRPAGQAPAGMTAKQHGRHDHRVDLELHQGRRLGRRADLAAGDMAGDDQS